MTRISSMIGGGLVNEAPPIGCLVALYNQSTQASQRKSLETHSIYLRAAFSYLLGHQSSSDLNLILEAGICCPKSENQIGSLIVKRQACPPNFFCLFVTNAITGKACFLCEDEHATRNFAVANQCMTCSPSVALPKQAPRILGHMAAHILFDSSIKQSDEPCGLCLRPSPLCKFYLKKTKGAGASEQVDFAKSSCANKVHFSYAVASSSTSSSPSSNVPLRCPICPVAEPCVWRYNLVHHMRAKHPTISLNPYAPLWELTNAEKRLLKEVWENRHKEKKTRKSRKNQSSTLIISEAHSSRLTLRYAL